MKRAILKLALASATVTGAMALGASAGQAQTFGNAPWCAVVNMGTGDVQWDCEYRTVEECVPNVLAGNRGSCTQNPYFHGYYAAAAPPAVYHRHYRRPRAY